MNALVGAAAAQTPPATGHIRGRVVEATTNAPLAAVLLQIEPAGVKVVSDADGQFEIRDVAAGPQTLLVSVVGFGLVRRELVVVAGEALDLVVPVSEGASTHVESVAVVGSRFREGEAGVASQSVLGSRELLALRGVIADDPFRAVQVLPGVAASDDFRAEFAVRGLGPSHVGLAIDEVDSPLLFHTVRGVSDTGSLALINSDILEEAVLQSGVHPQTRGAHLGARLDVRTRDGARDRLHVRALVSGSAATSVWEGPLGDGARGSWLLAARKSYVDWILRRVDTAIDGTFGFTDAQGKLTLTLTPAQTLRASVIGGRSELDEDDETSVSGFDRGRSRTVMANLQWRAAVSERFAVTQQIYAVDSRYLNRVVDGRPREEGGDRDITWRSGIEWSPRAQHLVQAGGQVQRLSARRVDRRLTNTSTQTILDVRPEATARALWLSYRWTPSPRWSFAPGLRAERWGIVNRAAVSPWVLAEWQVAPRTRLRAGVGVQHQAPGFDAVLIGRNGDPLTAERARVVDTGLEHRVGESWRTSVTVYHRRESNRLRTVNNEFRLVGGRIVRPGVAYVANVLSGRAVGAEGTVERRAPNGLSGWLSYAWGEAKSQDRTTGERYWADWDQRHTVNIAVAYRWSARSSVGGRYRYGSNFPLQGYLQPDPAGHVLSGQRNDARLPEYSRLDVRADRTFTFRRSRLTVFVEGVNVLGRRNVRARDGSVDVRTGRVSGLTERLFPRLPSAGLLIEF